MTHPPRNLVARALLGMGCVMVVVVPLAVMASCAFRGSTGDPQPPVHRTVAPAAVVYVPAPQRSSQRPRRYVPAPASRPAAARRAQPPAPRVAPRLVRR